MAFAALVGVCLLVALGYTLRAVLVRQVAPSSAADAPADASVLAEVMSRPHLVFLHSPGGDAYRQVAVVPLDALEGPRYLTSLQCQRVYMAGGAGLCMSNAQTTTTFDARFRPGSALATPGLPTRTRVALDGSIGSLTSFVTGHSYADASFSTHTVLVDPHTGGELADLEQFAIFKDGEPFRAVDFNFWGVTFARDVNRFYVTLASGGKTYLLQGDLARREARVLRENVECPSLSPDGTRLAFKKRMDPNSPREWRAAILDLRTLEDSPLPGESHSIDDQIEWLDETHVLYARQQDQTIAQDIWLASTDGSDPPRLLLAGALSPSVAR